MNEFRINDKMVGHTVKDVYITQRDRKKHFFRKFNGWGISEAIIDKLLSLGIKKVLIREEIDHLYLIEEFLTGQVYYDGDDKQYIVTEKKESKGWVQ